MTSPSIYTKLIISYQPLCESYCKDVTCSVYRNEMFMFIYIPVFSIFMWERKVQKFRQKILNSLVKNYFFVSRITCLVIIEIDMCMCVTITCIWNYWIFSIHIYCYWTHNNLAVPLVKRKKTYILFERIISSF